MEFIPAHMWLTVRSKMNINTEATYMPGYPVRITFDSNLKEFTGECRDFFNLKISGRSLREVQKQVHARLLAEIARYIREGIIVPEPSSGEPGEDLIRFSLLVRLKVALHNTMRTRGLRKSWLAQEMKLHAPQISRMLDVYHFSRVDMLEKALFLTGAIIHVSVVPRKMM
jgi:antitoxin HicB